MPIIFPHVLDVTFSFVLMVDHTHTPHSRQIVWTLSPMIQDLSLLLKSGKILGEGKGVPH